MKRKPGCKRLPKALNLAAAVVRESHGLKQHEMAKRTGYSKTAISYFESGWRKVLAKHLARIAKATEDGREEVEILVFGISVYLGEPELPPSAAGLSPAEMKRIGRLAAQRGIAEVNESLERMIAEAHARRHAEERAEAERLYRQIARFLLLKQEMLIEERGDLQTWAMVEKLCEESAKAATDDFKRALALANLALRCANSPGIPAGLRPRLQGYVWGFIGNARRVGSDLPAADEAFSLAWSAWRTGRRAGAALPIGAWRLQDLEASLRRAQRRGRSALTLLGRALKTAPNSEKGRLLLKKATTLEMMGQEEKAISVLYQAAEWVGPGQEPPMYFALRFNLAVNLELTGRLEEARALLPELRELATGLRSNIRLVRVMWLQARIHWKLGEHTEAIAALDQARREFCRKQMAYDAALASLELAVFLLTEGKTEHVKTLSEETLWVFDALRVHQAALASLRLFCDAAERQAATVALAQTAQKELRDARAYQD